MPTATYDNIASTTLGSNTASVTFSSLGSFTDLQLVIRARCTLTDAVNFYPNDVLLRFNGDSGNNYSYQYYSAVGWAGLVANRLDNQSAITIGGGAQNSYAAQEFSYHDIYIPSYRNTSYQKVNVTKVGHAYHTGDARRGVGIWVGNWKNTAAITSITVLPSNGYSFTTNSTFCLYGITAA